MITGDNRNVARHVAEAIGLPAMFTMTGRELNATSEEALLHSAQQVTIFAEMDPNQKDRVIHALRKAGHVVGYMGDGINDAPALHTADVGISVDTSVDVAKDAADFVLLRKDLGILREGIDEGRRTFANTLKYILTTISANFGNMFSMAVASVVLPFLPLLASQVLLNNFLADIPATTIASDNVDREWVAAPRRWDTRFIRDYMILFGLVSSVFDLFAFGVLLWLFRAGADEFRTGWFIESLLTELVIALVVRTQGPFWRSRTWQVPARHHLLRRRIHAGFAVPPVCRRLRIRPGAGAADAGNDRVDAGLRACRRDREAVLLRDVESQGEAAGLGGTCRRTKGGTDLHIIRGDVPTCEPGTIPGHEGVGMVESVGAGVAAFKPGARVRRIGQRGWHADRLDGRVDSNSGHRQRRCPSLRRDPQTARRTIMSRILPIAVIGLSPLGHTSEQFMIERQR
ncbi:HAD-IC family P-type ATPase [Ramlibacter sp. MMS24-I3-19]|uniref:HAD-IC family P-type ATPase n=1 Tax=Ramlibacter sp. MMS24-I3-19 TaxID=3416606 RepID=UPI003D02337D